MTMDTRPIKYDVEVTSPILYNEVLPNDRNGLRILIKEAVNNHVSRSFPDMTIEVSEIDHEAIPPGQQRPAGGIWSLLMPTNGRTPTSRYVFSLTLCGPYRYAVTGSDGPAWLTDTLEYLISMALIELLVEFTIEKTTLTYQ